MASPVTSEEHQIIALVAAGFKNCDIARIIGTTDDRVKNCLRTIYDKTGMWNRLELALWQVKEQDWRDRDHASPDVIPVRLMSR